MHAWFRENVHFGHQKTLKDIDAAGKDGSQSE